MTNFIANCIVSFLVFETELGKACSIAATVDLLHGMNNKYQIQRHDFGLND